MHRHIHFPFTGQIQLYLMRNRKKNKYDSSAITVIYCNNQTCRYNVKIHIKLNLDNNIDGEIIKAQIYHTFKTNLLV